MNKSIRVIACIGKNNFHKVIEKNGLFTGDVFNARSAYDTMKNNKCKTYFLVCKSKEFYIADPQNIEMPI